MENNCIHTIDVIMFFVFCALILAVYFVTITVKQHRECRDGSEIKITENPDGTKTYSSSYANK